MMLSRIADALYWMARNLERADNTARLVEINLLHLIGSGDVPGGSEQWHPLLAITGAGDLFSSSAGYPTPDKTAVATFLTQEHSNPNSIYNSIRLARENARVVRDRISKEMWESLNQSWLTIETYLRNPLLPDRAPAFYKHVRESVARFHGLTDGTLMGGESYGFYRLGTFMERADMTARILDVKYHILLPSVAEVGSALDYFQWGALLKSLSAFESFRRLYHIGIRPIDVTELVIFHPDFPRSLLFCVHRLKRALEEIHPGSLDSDSKSTLNSVLEFLSNNNPQSAFQYGLHEFLQEFLQRIAALNAAIQSDFFESHLGENNVHALHHPTPNPA